MSIFTQLQTNIPDWMPFACLITQNKVIRKGMITRIVESLFIAVISSAGSGYMVLHISMAKMEQRIENVERNFVAHVEAEKVQYAQLANQIRDIHNCLLNRTCSK